MLLFSFLLNFTSTIHRLVTIERTKNNNYRCVTANKEGELLDVKPKRTNKQKRKGIQTISHFYSTFAKRKILLCVSVSTVCDYFR